MERTIQDLIVNENINDYYYEIITKISKEEKEELQEASSDKKIVKMLVDQYYQSQYERIITQNQIRSLKQGYDEASEPHYNFINTILNNAISKEAYNKKCMDVITDKVDICRWMKSIMGIGPVLSAYIYATFDVKTGKYAGNFLSYAGLNDNNNPWLGKEKAKDIVDRALERREKSLDEFETQLKSFLCCSEKQFTNLKKKLTKLGKEDCNDFEEIESVIYELTGSNINEFEDYSNLFDYITVLANPKAITVDLYQFVANETGRDIKNIRKGTINNWERKKTKTKTPVIEDLIAYLSKPPYNTELKTKMFLIGESFIKVHKKPNSLYGRIYKEKKEEYTLKNENGEYSEQAEEILKTKNIGKNTDAYKSLIEGKLPKAQINSRARRYAVKLFISHVFEAMYYAEYGEEPPQTYVIEYLGHTGYIAPEVDYHPYINREL